MFNVGIISHIVPANVDGFYPYIESTSPDLWWKLDETSGANAVDSSGNGYTGGKLGFYTNGNAALFPGLEVSTGLTTPVGNDQSGVETLSGKPTITGDLTAMIFVRLTATPSGFPKLLNKPTDVATGQATYQLYVNPGTSKFVARMNFSSSYYDLAQSGTFSLDTSYMVLMRRSGTTLTIWINGVQQGSTTVPAGAADSSNGDVGIGKVINTRTLDDFAGLVSNAIVWARALSDEEIETAYTKAITSV